MSDPVAHAIAARNLLAAASSGVLATLAADGYPYASIVEVLPTSEGDIVLLLSDLAEHTRNLKADGRVSLVVAQDETEEGVLALGRATFQGTATRIDDGRTRYRAAYLERHPSAETYIDFDDFAFYRIKVERVRFIGGFGRMGWIDREDWTA